MDEVIEVSNFVYPFRFDDLDLFLNSDMTKDFDLSRLKALDPIFADTPTLLCLAAYFNAVKIGDYLLQNGNDIEKTDALNRSVVHFAAAGGSLNFMQLIRSNNGDFHARDKSRKTYVHYAAEYNQVDILNFAYVSGEHLDSPSIQGCPIHLACERGNLRAIEFLAQTEKCDLNRNIKQSTDQSVRNCTPVFNALNSNCYESLQLLQKHKMNLDQIIAGDWTALYYVIRAGNEHVADMLLDFGANPAPLNANRNGWLPIHVAAQIQNSRIITSLFKNGSPIHILTKSGYSPFAFALRPSISNQRDPSSTPYQAAKVIRDHEVEFLARYLFLSMLTEKHDRNYPNIVAHSIRKYYQSDSKPDSQNAQNAQNDKQTVSVQYDQPVETNSQPID